MQHICTRHSCALVTAVVHKTTQKREHTSLTSLAQADASATVCSCHSSAAPDALFKEALDLPKVAAPRQLAVTLTIQKGGAEQDCI